MWQHSHQVASYTNWWHGEPSNNEDNEDCVIKARVTLDSSIDFGWNDIICTDDYSNHADHGQIPGGIFALCMRN